MSEEYRDQQGTGSLGRNQAGEQEVVVRKEDLGSLTREQFKGATGFE